MGELGQAIPTQASPIEQLVGAQDSITGTILRCIEALETRLMSVCRPASPQNERGPGMETPGLSGLARVLHQHNQDLNQIHDRLESLIDRLEV
jgi:hypothetical protein